MRVWDTKNAIYGGLRALEWYRYLSAMWIICGELQDLYADRLTGPEPSLLSDSLAAVRAAVREHKVTDSTAASASMLALAWEPMITDHDVSPGHWNARLVIAHLAGEVAGTCRRYVAAERVGNAATMRFEEKPRPDGRPIRHRPDEQIDDASPKAEMLSRIQAIVTGLAQLEYLDIPSRPRMPNPRCSRRR